MDDILKNWRTVISLQLLTQIRFNDYSLISLTMAKPQHPAIHNLNDLITETLSESRHRETENRTLNTLDSFLLFRSRKSIRNFRAKKKADHL